MKGKLLIYMTFTLLLLACSHQKKKSVLQKVYPTDTACIQEITRAKKDFAEGKLVFCYYVGNIVFQPFRAEDEMKILLKKYNIEYNNESSPCVIQNNRSYHCYCECMQDRIKEKYGYNFTDSLLRVADSLYIIQHRDLVFDCGSNSSCWDIPAVYPGDSVPDQTNHSGLQIAFEKLVKYPVDYKFKKGDTSMAMLQVYLDIDENGRAKVTDAQFVFWDNRTKEEDYNKKYWSYFKKIAIPLIEKTTWTPAKIKSIGVKSSNDIFIYLK
jgi:hypothetical protein